MGAVESDRRCCSASDVIPGTSFFKATSDDDALSDSDTSPSNAHHKRKNRHKKSQKSYKKHADLVGSARAREYDEARRAAAAEDAAGGRGGGHEPGADPHAIGNGPGSGGGSSSRRRSRLGRGRGSRSKLELSAGGAGQSAGKGKSRGKGKGRQRPSSPASPRGIISKADALFDESDSDSAQEQAAARGQRRRGHRPQANGLSVKPASSRSRSHSPAGPEVVRPERGRRFKYRDRYTNIKQEVEQYDYSASTDFRLRFLDDGGRAGFGPNTSKLLGQDPIFTLDGNQKFCRVGTLKEGTCFFHSILDSLNVINPMNITEKDWQQAGRRSQDTRAYRNLTTEQRSMMGQRFRQWCARQLTHEWFDANINHAGPDEARAVYDAARDEMINYDQYQRDYADPEVYVGDTVWPHVAHVLDINLFLVIVGRTGLPQVLLASPYDRIKKTVVLYLHDKGGTGHYEAVQEATGRGVFTHSDDIVQKLLEWRN